MMSLLLQINQNFCSEQFLNYIGENIFQIDIQHLMGKKMLIVEMIFHLIVEV